MRTGLFGPAGALLVAARCATADPPPAKPVPPTPFAVPADLLSVPQLPEGAPRPDMNPKLSTGGPGSASPSQPAVPESPPTAGCVCPPTVPAWTDQHGGPREQLWINGGPLLWRLKHSPVPFLAASGTARLGGDSVDYGTFNGLKLDGGTWLNDCHTAGLTVGGFLLEQRSDFASLASNAAGAPQITRPIIDALTLTPVGVLVSAPGILAGGVSVATSARLWGADTGFAYNLVHTDDCTVDTLFGFRYLDLTENLDVTESTLALANGALFLGGVTNPVAALVLDDRFHTRNQFYGGQIGTRAEYRMGPVFVSLLSKVALGPNHEVVEITGSTREVGGAGRVLNGGLLAVGQAVTPTGPGGNIGRIVTNRFAVVPEVGGQIGCQVTRLIRLFVGYHFLYMNDVVRPGSQIDPAVNLRLVPSSLSFGTLSGQVAPRVTGRHDDFYAHGIQFGVDVRY